jgi:hypothetical protein
MKEVACQATAAATCRLRNPRGLQDGQVAAAADEDRHRVAEGEGSEAGGQCGQPQRKPGDALEVDEVLAREVAQHGGAEVVPQAGVGLRRRRAGGVADGEQLVEGRRRIRPPR